MPEAWQAEQLPHWPGYPTLVTVEGTAAFRGIGVYLDLVAHWSFQMLL